MAKRIIRITNTGMYGIMLMLGLVAGIIVFHFKSEAIYPAMCLYQELRVDKFLRSTVEPVCLLGYIAWQRVESFVFLLLTQITVLKHPVACIYSAACGFAGALLEAFYVKQYGVTGMLLFAATLFPHCIFYFGAWYELCTGKLVYRQQGKEEVLAIVKTVACAVLFVCLGILCEGTVNLWIMKKIFKNFC